MPCKNYKSKKLKTRISKIYLNKNRSKLRIKLIEANLTTLMQLFLYLALPK